MNNKIVFAFRYGKLKSKEREIIEFLYNQKNCTFKGGYSGIVRALGLSTYQNVSNYRRTILTLESKNIVVITKGKTKTVGQILAIALSSDWENNI